MNKRQVARLKAAKVRWAREDSQYPYTVYRRSRPAYVHETKSFVYEASFILLLFIAAVVAIMLSATN